MKGEIIVKSNATDLDWIIVRPISIWGPWNSQPYKQFFETVLSGFYFNLGKCLSIRSLGYVENSVHQLVSLMRAPSSSVSKKIFYLADYDPISLRAMAKKCFLSKGLQIYTFIALVRCFYYCPLW